MVCDVAASNWVNVYAADLLLVSLYLNPLLVIFTFCTLPILIDAAKSFPPVPPTVNGFFKLGNFGVLNGFDNPRLIFGPLRPFK